MEEIEAISNENNLHYFLIGANALSAHNYHTINTGSRMVAVAMPSDDIDIFCRIVKKEYKKDRYVEKSTNDKQDPFYHISYGNKNTADFIITNLNTNKQHGIRVRIYPIRKTIIDTIDFESKPSIKSDMKYTVAMYLRKHLTNRDAFYVKYGLEFLSYVYHLFVNSYRYLRYKYSKSIIKEDLFDVFGRDSWFIDSAIGLYRHLYSSFDSTYYFFKNLKKHPFIETWEDLEKYTNAQIINNEINTEAFDELDKIEVDGIDVYLPGSEFFIDIFGKNYEDKMVKSKSPRASAILDTENSYQKIIKERRSSIRKIKTIQREIRKTRFEVIDETNAVNNVFNLVKMTDAQIKVQRFFDRRREYLFSLDMDNEEEFIELCDRLTPTINYLRRYSEYNMTFSIDDEADALVKEVLLRIGEDELVNKLIDLSKYKYYIE